MKDKKTRQIIIRKLIEKQAVSNQEELLELLKAEGVNATQATLSRDLKDLRVVKMHNPQGGYSYAAPRNDMMTTPSSSFTPNHLITAVICVEFSNSFGVIKTRPGFANMLGSIIDSAIGYEFMGTIAGDDTLLLVLRNNADIGRLMSLLEKVIPGIEKKQI